MTAFQSLVLGQFTEPQVTEQDLAWARWYLATENYDRGLPGAWSEYDRQSWVPAHGWPHSLSMRYANMMRRELKLEGSCPRWMTRMKHNELLRWYEWVTWPVVFKLGA